MSKIFDATTRHLLEVDPRAWLEYCGVRTTAPVEIINSDLSTITTEADKVIRIGGEAPWLAHVELQASSDPDIALRLARYNILLEYRHRLPVLSILVLLRPEAESSGSSGGWRSGVTGRRSHFEFQFQTVRAWQQPVESVLAGGAAVLPLAPLTDVSAAELPQIVRRIEDRLEKEVSPPEADSLWTATLLLMGLRYPGDFAQRLLEGVRTMKESTTYQAILDEGIALGVSKGARSILLRLATKRFGAPSTAELAAIESLDDRRLQQLAEQILDVGSWRELLANA